MKLKKPQQLSDPFDHYSKNHLNKLINKPTNELNWQDFRTLFGPHKPAGNFNESLYYLPTAFKHMKFTKDDGLEIITPIIGFCSIHHDALQQHDLLTYVNDEITACMNHWTQSFTIIHYNQSDCLKKGWNSTYLNRVEYAEEVMEMINELYRLDSFKHLAYDFVDSIARLDHHIHHCWFLELSRMRYEINLPQPIITLLSDHDTIKRAYDQVYPFIINDSDSLTYWQDTRNLMGL